MALSSFKKAKITKLLKEGKLSKRAISRQEKVSRLTIDNLERKLLFPEEASSPQEYIRCKGCGGKVLKGIPCLLCQLRQKQISDYNRFMEDLLTPSPLSAHNGKKRN